jgi:hypothetical protein
MRGVPEGCWAMEKLHWRHLKLRSTIIPACMWDVLQPTMSLNVFQVEEYLLTFYAVIGRENVRSEATAAVHDLLIHILLA